MNSSGTALKILKSKLKKASISTAKAERYRVSMDNLRYSRMPSARLQPADEQELELIIKTANEHKVPITIRGAGSATTGTTSPVEDGWVVDLSAWNAIHIDPLSKMAYVQPGATIDAIDQAASLHGLSYPPDPGSKKYATIGGTIATNAGGLRGAKYGVTRDYILSLEGFMPTGEFVRWGANLKKFSAGYNIKDLWIGSEGMLGIITGCVLKLIPKPKAQRTAVFSFKDESIAIEAVKSIFASSIVPSVLEFLDSQTTKCTTHFWNKIAPEKLASLPSELKKQLQKKKPPVLLLVEVDGDSDASVDDQFNQLSHSLATSPHHCFNAEDGEMATNLWQIRRSCSQAMFELADTKLNEDVVVPLDAYEALIDYTLKLKRNTGLHTPTFGHAADGNFHVHIMYNRSSPTEKRKAEKAIQELMKKVVELGGAISGEHGIGLAKCNFLSLQHSQNEIDVMQRIKTTFDPNNILNSDKLFTSFSPWEHPREDVKMPWDH